MRSGSVAEAERAVAPRRPTKSRRERCMMIATMYCMRVKIRLQRGASWQYLPVRSTAGRGVVAALRGPCDIRPRSKSLHGHVPLRSGIIPDRGAQAFTDFSEGNDSFLHDQFRPVLSADRADGRNSK